MIKILFYWITAWYFLVHEPNINGWYENNTVWFNVWWQSFDTTKSVDKYALPFQHIQYTAPRLLFRYLIVLMLVLRQTLALFDRNPITSVYFSWRLTVLRHSSGIISIIHISYSLRPQPQTTFPLYWTSKKNMYKLPCTISDPSAAASPAKQYSLPCIRSRFNCW